jgi:uncharacterized protein
MRAVGFLTMLLVVSSLEAQEVPRAVYADPPHDAKHPARLEVLHVPSGGVAINGVAYVAAGGGRHPTLVLLHGLPGNEKNLDLAQAVRRAGWNAVTVNYRGSWGSPGVFRFAQNVEDARSVLAYLRDSANARALAVDTTRLVLAGHSMGGWVAGVAGADDPHLAGVVLISAADMGLRRTLSRADAVQHMKESMESLAGGTAETFADDLLALPATLSFASAARGLAGTPLLVLTSDDGLAPESDSLVAAVRRQGGKAVTTVHAATDHAWSDRRIALESAVLRWLARLPRRESSP